MTPRGRVLALAALLGASNPAAAELQVVVDAEGRTRITDVAPDLPGPLDAATASDVEGLRGLWDDGLVGEPVEGSSDSSGEADRLRRALRAAVLDAQRGETARASAALEAVLRMVVLGRSERLDAHKAMRLGLVSEVVPRERLLDRALELARLAASNSPHAIRHSLQALWQGLDLGLEDALANAWNHIVEHRSHPDSREGGRAFLEKRAPDWQD